MNSEFLCKADGTVFGSKEQAISHLRANYIKKTAIPTDLVPIKQQLEAAFPDFYVEVTQGTAMICSLKGIHVRGAFEFFIAPSLTPFEETPTLRSFTSVEEAIHLFSQLLVHFSDHRRQILALVSPYDPTIDDLFLYSITQEEDDPQLAVVYEAKRTDGTQKAFTTLYLTVADFDNETTLQEELAAHLAHLSGRYVTHLEGPVKLVLTDDYYGTKEYEINGVRINDLAKRAKTMRVTLIETEGNS